MLYCTIQCFSLDEKLKLAGEVAQLAEQLAPDQQVISSNLVFPFSSFILSRKTAEKMEPAGRPYNKPKKGKERDTDDEEEPIIPTFAKLNIDTSSSSSSSSTQVPQDDKNRFAAAATVVGRRDFDVFRC